MGDQSLLPSSVPAADWTETDESLARPLTTRQRVHDMVEGTLDTWFEYTLLGVIFVNVLFLIVSTIPTGRDGDWCAPRAQAAWATAHHWLSS